LKYSPDSHFVYTSYAVLSLLKLVRPEFQAFLDNADKTVALVRDVADVLERIAVNPQHTPALYSGFLRALIAAKADSAPPSRSELAQPPSDMTSETNGDLQSSLGGQLNSNGHGEPQFMMDDFHFASEMGPVADMSTFPPTMMASSPMDHSGMLSMDSMLSNGFWDSVLVPGYSNTMEGLSGGFVFGMGGGRLTPRMGGTPLQSGSNTPSGGLQSSITQHNINSAFHSGGLKMDA
jgi:hypothetical protein